MDNEKLSLLLDHVIPFRFLPGKVKRDLAGHWQKRAVPADTWIYRAGDRDRGVFLLDKGLVLLGDDNSREGTVNPVNLVRPGHYFGERALLLAQNRTLGARALEESLCWYLAPEVFQSLLAEHRIFAQSFGSILRDKHGVFRAFEHFRAELERHLNLGYIPLHRFTDLYRELEPALHPHCGDKNTLDLGALVYALRRLPENLTRTFAWYLSDDIPASYRSPDDLFCPVATAARRRNIWEMLPGKNLVLIRNGNSDIMDLITCLCLYSVEANKLRQRLYDPRSLQLLRGSLESQEKDPSRVRKTLEALPFNSQEIEGLWSLWGKESPQRLYELCLHHEDYTIVYQRQYENYNSRRSEKWTIQLTRATRELLGMDPGDMDDDWEVHIISSNTHSVTNCLNPRIQEKKKEIRAWAAQKGLEPDSTELEYWVNQEDLVYAFLPEYQLTNPGIFRSEDERDWGILRLEDTASTGIRVQLVDTRQLQGDRLDPGIQGPAKDRKILIVNIDYAFGEQADEILGNLIMLYSRNIRSINVLGKAGALQGRRGDILIPTAFILQDKDEFIPVLSDDWDVRLDGLCRREIHRGPLLTVAGTLLQNPPMLNFYRNIWGCKGMEMEGAFYARQAAQAGLTGVLSPGVVTRFGYYVSDLPLAHGQSLSQGLQPREGLPPLYAITRALRNALFQDEGQRRIRR